MRRNRNSPDSLIKSFNSVSCWFKKNFNNIVKRCRWEILNYLVVLVNSANVIHWVIFLSLTGVMAGVNWSAVPLWSDHRRHIITPRYKHPCSLYKCCTVYRWYRCLIEEQQWASYSPSLFLRHTFFSSFLSIDGFNSVILGGAAAASASAPPASMMSVSSFWRTVPLNKNEGSWIVAQGGSVQW